MSDSKKQYIYAIRSRTWVKIGLSNHPKKRLAEIQVCNPTKIHLAGYVEGTRSDEGMIHLILTRWRTRGEWFDYKGMAVDVVDRIIKFDTATEVLDDINKWAKAQLKECEAIEPDPAWERLDER